MPQLGQFTYQVDFALGMGAALTVIVAPKSIVVAKAIVISFLIVFIRFPFRK